MSYGAHKHIKLILRTLPSGQAATVMVKQATAEHFGWTNHFETEAEWTARRVSEGAISGFYYRGRPGRTVGGTPIRIGTTQHAGPGYEAGAAHQFRIGSKVSIADLAELAHFTDGNWEWMEDRTRRRIPRGAWLQRYSLIP